LLHGRLKSGEKNGVVAKFRAGEYNILVSTPVVEVGIDIPSATIMVIEDAERFGLAQLHQLRGRVGRGAKQGFCLLFTEDYNEYIISRLKILEKSTNGNKIAEMDLKLRGPGQMYGTRQHGTGDLKLQIASLSDEKTIEKTRFEAKLLLDDLNSNSLSPPLQEALKRYTIKAIAND